MDSFEGERNCAWVGSGRQGVGSKARRVFRRPGFRFHNSGWRLLLGLGVLAATAGASPFGVATMSRLGFETVELRGTEENHLFVSGRANGRRVSCLVDTGWSFTTMQPATGAADSAVPTLQLGRVAFTNQPARVERIMFHRQPASFDVVLGLDFLRRHFAVLDCGSRRLFTRPAAMSEVAQTEFEDALRQAGYAAIPLQLKMPPALTLEARVNGQPVEMLLDSGAAWSCLDQRQCARLKLKPSASTTRITGAGTTGVRPVAVAEVKSLQLGGLELRNATLALFDLADWGFAAPEKALREVQGILGGECLAETSAVIDCHRLKLWVKPRGRR